jgi:hypothetical protein
MLRRSLLSLVCLSASALSAGCGPSPVYEADRTETTSGDETVTTATPPAGPPPSFLVMPATVFARIDVARIRASPIGPDISSAIRSTQTWQTYAGSSGIDPIDSFDAIVIRSDAVYADRRTILLRHTQTDAQVRDAILRMSVARGGTATWSDVDGFAVAVPPQTLPVPHSVVLTAEHEVVLTPSDDVARVTAIAHAQAARRVTPTDAIDPSLAFAPNEIIVAHVDEPPARRSGMPEPPQRYDLWVTEDPATHGVEVRFHGDFDTVEHCHQSREWLAGQASYYASQMLVRAAGLNRPLEALVLTEQGTQLDGRTTFTVDELRRALGAMALMQLQGGGPPRM